jgi:hypothetical protein
MSIEALLVLALVVGLPLLERYLDRMRSRNSDHGEPTAPLPVPARKPAARRAPQPAVPQPAAPQSADPQMRPRPSPQRPRVSPRPAATAKAAPPANVVAATAVAPPAKARTPARHAVPLRVPRIDGGDLRRAVVLAAVLGPCAALDQATPTWDR